ncbi:MAG TPA: PEP/pyruvate-binding domain-containing protein [Nitrospirota bacterium]|nr:PEP/pyruvate-binding domain-containing protein [Nitrospirota bacterium]
MKTAIDICSLDYLIGTLATAYKGVITSLVVKDFCMTEEGNLVTLKGTVLSMPEGDYEGCLIQSGAELARTALERGYFELKAGSERVKSAKDLQIDIVQSGRHVGTFLLKKESTDGIYISAVELSDELKDMDFKRLTTPLRDKVGLLQKAEEIISKILSTKKDWSAFSEKLNGFSIDLFWSARNVYYGAYTILVHFLLKAAERTDVIGTSKPVSNLLEIMELPLERETDPKKLQLAAAAWLREVKDSSVNLSVNLRRAVNVLSSVDEKFSDAEIEPVIRNLLNSVKEKAASMPTFGLAILHPVSTFLSLDEYELLNKYGDRGRQEFSHKLSDVVRFIESKEYRRALDIFADLDTDILDDEKMVAAFFEIAGNHISEDHARSFSTALIELFAISPKLSRNALENIKSNTPMMFEKLSGFGRIDACAGLLSCIREAGSPLKEDIMTDPKLAASLLNSGSDELIALYTDDLKQIVIPAAKVSGHSADTWAEIVNPLHLERLSKFMDMLQLGSRRLQDVFIHVIANLYVSGVHIPDDKLYQRRVSAYLNSEAMKLPFFLNHLFLEKLPVYFNEVGAVSRTRDYSTELDSWGNDPVLYFLRKQVHVNASNYNVRLIEEIINSWVNDDPALLRAMVPRDMFGTLKPELFHRYSTVIKPFLESVGVIDADGLHIKRLLDVTVSENHPQLRDDGQVDEIRTKVILICKLYQEIVGKYSLLSRDHVRRDPFIRLSEQFDKVKSLKQTVLSPEKTVAQESLYFKRHIAFGIPSVLGSYHEPKFDALGEMLRREAELGALFEEVLSGIEDKAWQFLRRDLSRWLSSLTVMHELLKLEGLENAQVDEIVTILKNGRLRISQIVDLLGMWQKELAWIVEFVTRTFHQSLVGILGRYPKDELPEYLMNLNSDEKDFANKAADIIIRDMMTGLTGLVEVDRIIDKLIRALKSHVADGADEELDVDEPGEHKTFFVIQELTARDAMRLAPLIGGKAKNLVYLSNLGFRVPPGLVFSSLHTPRYKEFTNSPNFMTVLKQAVKKIEDRSGTFFGDKDNPLFLSVRSGSYVSMPGILSTILYCGMNRDTLRAFMKNTGNPSLAWDSYRRFIEHYGTVALGLDMALFDNIMNDVMKKHAVTTQGELALEHLEEIAGLYERELSRRGMDIPNDVYEQLRQSVQAVYASWYSERAEQFRNVTETSVHWGTSVTLMQMVFGNDAGAGASVFFTRNPFTYKQAIYGETRENATGDDLVYGRQENRPLSKEQIRAGRESLEEVDPHLYFQHQELAKRIEDAMGGLPQEVEVTYTKDADGNRVISVLQTRRMEAGEDFFHTFDDICRMESRIIGRGIAAYGGALSGVATFTSSPEHIQELIKTAGMPAILLRKTASTDDVSLMPVIRGIITSAGGITSHAAVLAWKFHVTAVVACSDMTIEINEQGESYAMVGGVVVKEGTAISIDGSTGLIFSGICLSTGRINRH